MIQSANLILRFVLEVLALIAVGYWGFRTQEHSLGRIAAGVGLPLLMATVWSVFRVAGDGGDPIVAVAPQLRLLIEAVVFGLGIGLLYASGQRAPAVIFLLALMIHYGIDYQRVADFLAGRGPSQ